MNKESFKKSYVELETLLLTKYGAVKMDSQEAVKYIPLTYGGIEEAKDKLAFATDDLFCLEDQAFLLPSKCEKIHKGVCEKTGCVLLVSVADGCVRWWKTYGADGDYHTGSEFYKEIKTFLPQK